MNFCPYCGAKLEPTHRYCTACGKAVPENKEVKKDDPEIEEVAFKAEEKQAPRQEPDYQRQYQDPSTQRITYEYIVGGQRQNNTYNQSYQQAPRYEEPRYEEPRYREAPKPVINNKKEMTLAFVFAIIGIVCAFYSDIPIISLFTLFPCALIFRGISMKNYKKYISLGNPDVGLAKAAKIINKIILPMSIAFAVLGTLVFVIELINTIQNGGEFDLELFFYNLFGTFSFDFTI